MREKYSEHWTNEDRETKIKKKEEEDDEKEFNSRITFTEESYRTLASIQ